MITGQGLEAIFFTTVRIETDGPSGAGCGTGFLATHLVDGGASGCVFLVTNKHVIGDATTGKFFFIAQKPDGTPDITQRREFTITSFQAAWVGHPDPKVDVTVANVSTILNVLNAQGTPAFMRSVPTTEFATDEKLASECLPVEDVTVLGYPNGWISNNLPLARRGITASPPALDVEGRPQLLLDVPIVPGSSGSPVFICNVGGYATKNGFVSGSRFLLIGIVSSFLYRDTRGEWVGKAVPTAPLATMVIKENTGLAAAFKARAIREAIEKFLKVHPQ